MQQTRNQGIISCGCTRCSSMGWLMFNHYHPRTNVLSHRALPCDQCLPVGTYSLPSELDDLEIGMPLLWHLDVCTKLKSWPAGAESSTMLFERS